MFDWQKKKISNSRIEKKNLVLSEECHRNVRIWSFDLGHLATTLKPPSNTAPISQTVLAQVHFLQKIKIKIIII